MNNRTFLLLIFAKGTQRYVHFLLFSSSFYEEGQRVKKTLGKGWILSNIQDAEDTGGILFDAGNLPVNTKCLLEVQQAEKEELSQLLNNQ